MTYYLVTTKETKHARRSKSNLLREIARKPYGLRVTGRRRQRLIDAATCFFFNGGRERNTCRPSQNLVRFPPSRKIFLLLLMSDRSSPRNQLHAPFSHLDEGLGLRPALSVWEDPPPLPTNGLHLASTSACSQAWRFGPTKGCACGFGCGTKWDRAKWRSVASSLLDLQHVGCNLYIYPRDISFGQSE